MMELTVSGGVRFCDGYTRREMLQVGALGAMGLSLPQLLHQLAHAKSRRAQARSVIILFLSGGPSHLDTFDMKPDAPEEIRGTFRPISTKVPGLHICEHFPRTSRLADRLVVIRSMHHTSGNHPAASYWMMTGSPIARPAPQSVTLSREDRPHLGSVLAKFLGARRPGVPAYVTVPELISPVGPPRPGQHAGFLGAAYDPYRVDSDPNLPDYSPGELRLTAELDAGRLQARRSLLEAVNRQAQVLADADNVAGLDPYLAQAFDLVTSAAAQSAFDIEREPPAVRDRYGRHTFGQSVLLARRLIEAGVRLVQVNWVRHDNGKGGQGYDSHRDHLAWCEKELFPPTDAAFASLLEDLEARGLLEETLVVLMGEFGRTPRFNSNAGRDHWPQCFTVVLAGGGLPGGIVYGASDRIGAFPTAQPVTPQDLFATIYHRLGLDPEALIYDQQGRPYHLAQGQPISALL
ncbi:MAG: DUF1501 domain-containing protein [Gemmatales bacterium]|nr:DUF1501 domain-containing protein [Gemmatales bacterium]